MKYTTTAAYVSGAICGAIWQPGFDNCGIPFRSDVRRQIERFSNPSGTTFRDVLLHMLMENGGDFQNPEFTSDTVLRIERRAHEPNGKGYRVHVFERKLSALRNCADLVRPDTFTVDYLGDCNY